MTKGESMEANEAKTGTCALTTSQPGYRRWVIGGAVLAIAAALYLGWDWLTAVGLAGVLLVAAPCLAMCALGLCMRGKSNDGPTHAEIRKTYEVEPSEPPQRG
jgi:hypothetical protein